MVMSLMFVWSLEWFVVLEEKSGYERCGTIFYLVVFLARVIFSMFMFLSVEKSRWPMLYIIDCWYSKSLKDQAFSIYILYLLYVK